MGWRLSAAQSLAGGLVAGALAYLAALISARLLGPEGFGRISLALIVAQVLSLLVVRGLDFSSARAVVLASEPSDVRAYVGTAYVVVASGAMALGLLLVLVADTVSSAIGWAPLSVMGAGLFLLPLSLRAVNERLLPALDLTRLLAIVRPVEGLLLLGSFAVLVSVHAVSPHTVLAAMFGAACLVVLGLIAVAGRRRLIGAYRRSAHRVMTPYARVILAIALVPLPLQFGDRLLIQTHLSEADLGLYVACATATQLLAAQVVALLSGVVLPQLMREGVPAIRRLRRAGALVVLPAGVGLALALLASLIVLGSSYSPPTALVVLFAAVGALTLTNGLLHIVVLAHPVTLRLDVRLTAVRAFVYICVLLLLAWTGRATLVTIAATLVVAEGVQAALLVWLTTCAEREWDLPEGAVEHR